MAIRYRNEKGQFATSGKYLLRESYNPKTMKTIKRYYKLKKPKVPTYKKYIYILSFNYAKKGEKGKHPFHSEVRFVSPHVMTNSDIWDYITSRESELPLHACEMNIKGVEIEEADYEPETSYKVLSWKH